MTGIRRVMLLNIIPGSMPARRFTVVFSPKMPRSCPVEAVTVSISGGRSSQLRVNYTFPELLPSIMQTMASTLVFVNKLAGFCERPVLTENGMAVFLVERSGSGIPLIRRAIRYSIRHSCFVRLPVNTCAVYGLWGWCHSVSARSETAAPSDCPFLSFRH